ncbi:caspase, EACC1-associated type [Streptomyces sp. NPDC002276]
MTEANRSGGRYALLVATASYQDERLRSLWAPTRDARQLARVLEDPAIGDFTVALVDNPSSHALRRRIEDFFADRATADTLLLHFAGHGLKDDTGRLFLAASDTVRSRLESTAVPAEYVGRLMMRSSAQRVALLLDCCYAGAFERGMISRSDDDVHVEDSFTALRRTVGERGRAVLTATSAVEYAFEGNDVPGQPVGRRGPSLFTGALVEGLRTGDADLGGDGIVGLSELAEYVGDRVRAVTPHQNPQLWMFGGRGDIPIAHAPHHPQPPVPARAPAPSPGLPVASRRRPRVRLTRTRSVAVATLLTAGTVTASLLLTNQTGSGGQHGDTGPSDRPRGNILVDGKPVTASKDTGHSPRYQRTYTDGPLYAPVTGFVSPTHGTSLLEKAENTALAPTDDDKGRDVLTTISAAAQKAAFSGLGRNKGAVVALDPTTGAILALVSTPSYDPNSITGSSTGDQQAWNDLRTDRDTPLLNRALNQVYPPASPFEVVTAASALETGLYQTVTEPTDSPLPYLLPGTGTELRNEGSPPCRDASLTTAMRVSCNTVFGKIGADLGQRKMLDQAQKFGFNDSLAIPVPISRSNFDTKMDSAQTALSALGQFDTTATPLQMAMVAAAVANDGRLMKPYLVAETRTADGRVTDKHAVTRYAQPLSTENARQLQLIMKAVVDKGNGSAARIDGVMVGGKSGIAQQHTDNANRMYAWFISYAMTADHPRVAVAVVVEGDAAHPDATTGELAAPIARKVMQAVLAD